MVSMVLEAAQQMVDTSKTTLSFQMRDISFLAPMNLLEDVATEVTIHIRPHLVGTSGSTQASWWELTVCSCTGLEGSMRNSCRGPPHCQLQGKENLLHGT